MHCSVIWYYRKQGWQLRGKEREGRESKRENKEEKRAARRQGVSRQTHKAMA